MFTMRSITFSIAAAMVAALVAGWAAPAEAAKPFTQLWVFGDSTVDAGWYKKSPYSGESNFDTYFMHASTDKIGKPIDNPSQNSVQVLGTLLSITTVTPQNTGGTDYATGGARNNQTNVAGSGFFPKAVPTIKQMSHYLVNNTASAKGLYVISSGGNDVSYAVKQVKGGQMTDAQGQAYVKTAANQLGAKAAALKAAGASHIIVANQPKDFGPTTDNTKPYRALYNSTLQAKLNSGHVNYAWADVNAVRHDIINDPADFGITNTNNATPACTTPDPSTTITTAWAFVCSSASPVSTPTAYDPATTLFADDQHWSSGGQKVLGSYYFCLAKHKWPTLFGSYSTQPPFACSLFGL